MERDGKGRFIKGHKDFGDGMKAANEHNRRYGVWNKGKKTGPQTEEMRIKKSETMQDKHKNPTWNEEKRKNKISEKLKGHEVADETREILRKKGKKSKQQGTNFEYRALHFMETQKGVIQVIRGAGSRDIDLTVIWQNGNSFLISKEEVKSSLKWFKTISKNPLTLLDKWDKEKLKRSWDKGFQIFLIYREPKKKLNGETMSRQTDVRRIELEIADGQIRKKEEFECN